jgi:hypothetical protein
MKPIAQDLALALLTRVKERGGTANKTLRARLLGEVLGDATWQPTFVFYMGYPKWTAHTSPRRCKRPCGQPTTGTFGGLMRVGEKKGAAACQQIL